MADVILYVLIALFVIGGLSLGWSQQGKNKAAKEFYDRENRKAREE